MFTDDLLSPFESVFQGEGADGRRLRKLQAVPRQEETASRATLAKTQRL